MLRIQGALRVVLRVIAIFVTLFLTSGAYTGTTFASDIICTGVRRAIDLELVGTHTGAIQHRLASTLVSYF